MERVNLRWINHNIQRIQTSEDDGPCIGCSWKAVRSQPIFLQEWTQAWWPDIYAADTIGRNTSFVGTIIDHS